MRIASFSENGGTRRAGVVLGDEVVALEDIDGASAGVLELVSAAADVGDEVAAHASTVRLRTPLSEVTLRAPISRPSKYLAIGFNYTSHLQEIAEAVRRPEFAEAAERFCHLFVGRGTRKVAIRELT